MLFFFFFFFLGQKFPDYMQDNIIMAAPDLRAPLVCVNCKTRKKKCNKMLPSCGFLHAVSQAGLMKYSSIQILRILTEIWSTGLSGQTLHVM